MGGLILIWIIVGAFTATSVPTEVKEPLNAYERFINFTSDDGSSRSIDIEAKPDYQLLDYINNYFGDTRFLLYTRSNPTTPQALFMDNASSITNSNFNPSLLTIVVAHGWINNENSKLNPTIRDACLRKDNVNVIIVGWGHLAFANYVTAARGVPVIGRRLGKFLAFLISVTDALYDLFHFVGFSLGAHLVGCAGRELGGKVARITGLDPAGPLFVNNVNRLSPSDAQYVEGIHTNGAYTFRIFGIGVAIGHADFYPNGGVRQPGCLTDVASHNRVWQIFAASILYNHFIGNKCSSSNDIAFNWCFGEQFSMGNIDLKKTGTGLYCLTTKKSDPF